jgi:imidazole glycerol-phosphate synthase subunit HisF
LGFKRFSFPGQAGMIKHRIIPVVLLDGYSVVKTIKFDTRRNLGNPIAVAQIYNGRNVDELVLLDIDASKNGLQIDEFTIENIASECFMPLTVGGGLRTCEDISRVLSRGADKVVLNSIVLEYPAFVAEASSEFGAQCITVSVDVKRSDLGANRVYSHSGRAVDVGLLEWVRDLERLGAGEIILNSVDQDGCMDGPDLELIRSVSSRVNIPVVAVGGLQEPADAVQMILSGASAVGAASVFHFTSITPDDLKEEMHLAGLPVRIQCNQ